MLIILSFVVAALLPALILMKYIYNKDSIEREPKDLLLKLAIAGAFSIIPAILLESAGQYLLGKLLPSSSIIYSLMLMFLVVAPTEEGCKYYFLNKRTWNHPAFNYQFDGVVYAVFVSLGFAALENIGYIFQYGLSIALTRALLSVPAHMSFAVFMGSFYGRAKVCSTHQDQRGVRRNKRIGIIIAILLHGFYNSCLLINSTSSLFAFSVFVVILYIIVIRKIKMDAAFDVALNLNDDVDKSYSSDNLGE